MSIIIDLRIALAAAVMALQALPSIEAQTPSASTVTLIQLDAPVERGATVYRRAGAGSDRDVIALAPEATAEDLSQALRVLDALYIRFGASPQRDVAAAVRSERAPSQPSANAAARQIQHGALISVLRKAARRNVASFGVVRAIEIGIPTRARR